MIFHAKLYLQHNQWHLFLKMISGIRKQGALLA